MKMTVTQVKNITIGDLVKDYEETGDAITAYGGKLDVRPPFQRSWIYNDRQKEAVIETVFNGRPLNVMYWAQKENDEFEIIDGQQRTISICHYVRNGFFAQIGDFPEKRKFVNLQDNEQEKILEYPLLVYRCEGTPDEKLMWFKTINIAGEPLNDQELFNAVYHGPWVSDAKKYFSTSNCGAAYLASDYVMGSVKRQQFLNTAIMWIAKGEKVDRYMADHQHDADAKDLWVHFENVVKWVKNVFPVYRPQMKGVDWGVLYSSYGDKKHDSGKIEKEVKWLMGDKEVGKKSGIYSFVLSRDEKHLNLRVFSPNQKTEAYERQDHKCAECGNPFPIEKMQADHIDPWSAGGKTTDENCQVLCGPCNRKKSNL